MAERVAQEELGPKTNVQREPGCEGHEITVALPFPYYGAVSCDSLHSKTPEQAERVFRSMCQSIRRFIADAVKKHDDDEQRRMMAETEMGKPVLALVEKSSE